MGWVCGLVLARCGIGLLDKLVNTNILVVRERQATDVAIQRF